MTILKGQKFGVDSKSFKSVLESFDGYDVYKVSDCEYVRFSNSAFLSNYKRNELLTSELDLYCISVGSFERDRFDFQESILEFSRTLSSVSTPKTIADVFLGEESEKVAPQSSSIKKKECTFKKKSLPRLADSTNIADSVTRIQSSIIGQEDAIHEIV